MSLIRINSEYEKYLREIQKKRYLELDNVKNPLNLFRTIKKINRYYKNGEIKVVYSKKFQKALIWRIGEFRINFGGKKSKSKAFIRLVI